MTEDSGRFVRPPPAFGVPPSGGIHPHRLKAGLRAFSLVEITIALGIFAFAMVGILGLLPGALTSARESLDVATATQMANHIAASYSQAAWSTLVDGQTNKHFNDLGENVPQSDPAAVYRAIVDIDDMTDSANLKRVAIRILRNSTANTNSGWAFCYLVPNKGD